jgi:hypothetical protein
VGALLHQGAGERPDAERHRDERLTDWILASELLARERLIDHHDAFAVRGVVRVEGAAGHQRHAERFEVAFGHGVILRLRRLARRGLDAPADAERHPP